MRVEDRLGIVEDQENLLGRKEGSKGCQILGIFDPCAYDLRESVEEMDARRWNLITTDKSTVIAEPLPGTIIVENTQGNGRFPNST